jgi:hypothetical protein
MPIERPHIRNGEFQSDKYPTCPPGKVPLSVKDPTAQDLLWRYAERRRAVDAEFADDLEFALRFVGYEPPIVERVELPPSEFSTDHAAYMTADPTPSADGLVDCRACHKAISVMPGDDPTPMCDSCAQLFLIETFPTILEGARVAQAQVELLREVSWYLAARLLAQDGIPAYVEEEKKLLPALLEKLRAYVE